MPEFKWVRVREDAISFLDSLDSRIGIECQYEVRDTAWNSSHDICTVLVDVMRCYGRSEVQLVVDTKKSQVIKCSTQQ